MRRKRWLWIVLAVLLGVVGLGAVAASRRGPKGTEVQVAKVERADLQAKVSANGRIQAQKKVDISATVAGQITQLSVEEGDVVKKGQFLLQIDPVGSRAAARSNQEGVMALSKDVNSAHAALDQARADLNRTDGNFRAGIVPMADLERARTAVATQQAALEAAERRVAQARASLAGAQDLVAKTTIRSPMDGVVTARRVEEGEVAVIGVQNSPGTVLLTISDMSVVEAELEVDETSIPSVHVGQEAKVRLDAFPNQTFRGTVTEVGSSPILNAANQAIKFEVKVRVDDPPSGIKPGLSARADILTGFRPNALVVPLQALVVRDVAADAAKAAAKSSKTATTATTATVEAKDQEGVYLMENGKARFVTLETGLVGELSVEVASGLRGGETLIIGPFKALRELEPGGAVVIEKPKKDKGRSGRSEPSNS